MGDIKPEDRTTLVASAFAIIAGLITAGGGLATYLAAEEANDRQEHSGDIARIGGITAMTGGLAAAVGGAVAVVMKLVEIRQREDAPAAPAAVPAPGGITDEQLRHLIDTVDHIRAAMEADQQVVQEVQDQNVHEQV
jgi:hypothetical protein